MRVFHTPAKSKKIVRIAVAVTLLSPIVVLAHFSIRLFRNDYPWNGDAIAIPIFSYWIFIFPFSLLFLVLGLRRYTEGVFLFNWNLHRFGRSAWWTLLALFPLGLSTVSMILDGINGRLYWVSAFFVLHLYCIAIFRTSIIAYEPNGADAKAGRLA